MQFPVLVKFTSDFADFKESWKMQGDRAEGSSANLVQEAASLREETTGPQGHSVTGLFGRLLSAGLPAHTGDGGVAG